MDSNFNRIKKNDIDNRTTTHTLVWVRKLKFLVKKEQKFEVLPDALAFLVETILLLMAETLHVITIPVDRDVLKTYSRHLSKHTTSCDQSRRHHDVWKKLPGLGSVEDVWFTSHWRCPIYNELKTVNLRSL